MCGVGRHCVVAWIEIGVAALADESVVGRHCVVAWIEINNTRL